MQIKTTYDIWSETQDAIFKAGNDINKIQKVDNSLNAEWFRVEDVDSFIKKTDEYIESQNIKLSEKLLMRYVLVRLKNELSQSSDDNLSIKAIVPLKLICRNCGDIEYLCEELYSKSEHIEYHIDLCNKSGCKESFINKMNKLNKMISQSSDYNAPDNGAQLMPPDNSCEDKRVALNTACSSSQDLCYCPECYAEMGCYSHFCDKCKNRVVEPLESIKKFRKVK